MKRNLIFIFCCLLSWEGSSQLILNQEGEAFTDQPFFNTDVILSKRIKSIEGNYSTKKPGEVIHESKDLFRYLFDEQGRLIESMEIHTINRQKDTTLHQYGYDHFGRLCFHRKSENGGFTRVTFEYDSLHHLTIRQTFRDIYHYPSPYEVRSFLLNVEYVNYSAHDHVQMQTTLNNEHLPYMELISSFNDAGYLLQRKTIFLMSGIEHRMDFTYNELGLLASKAHFNDQDQLADEEWNYHYDSYGNLMEAHFSRYGQFQKDLQVIFDSKTQLLGAIIQREVATNFMRILRFTKYTYY